MALEIGPTPERPLVNRYIPNLEYKRPAVVDQGFISDVKDEFALTWVGALLQNTFVLDQKIYKEKPEDPNYDPLHPDNLRGFEEYADKFLDVRNKEHHDFIKQQIWNNNARRTRLDASDRVWSPILVSALADPITYVPIPLARGVGFATRFAKGAAIGGGLVAATEPIRRTQDPTSTGEETAFIIGGAGLISGLLSGIAGNVVSRGTSRITTKNPPGPVTKKLAKKVSDNNTYNKYHKEMDIEDGLIQWEDQGFKTLRDNKTIQYKVEYIDAKKFKGSPHAKFDSKTNTMYLNDLLIRKDYETGRFMTRGKTFPMDKTLFKSPDDVALLEMKAAEIREIYTPFDSWKKSNPKGTTTQYNNEIYMQAYADLTTGAGGIDLNKHNPLLKWGRMTSTYQKIVTDITDPEWQDFVHRLAYNGSIRMKGGTPNESALINSKIELNTKLTKTQQLITSAYLKDRGLDPKSVRGDLGINWQYSLSNVGDRADALMDRINGSTDVTQVRQMDVYSREITYGLMDNDYAATLTKSQRYVIKAIRKDTNDFAEFAENNNLFETTGAYTKKVKDGEEIVGKLNDILENQILTVEQSKVLREMYQRKFTELKALRAIAKGKDLKNKYRRQENYIALFPKVPSIVKETPEYKKRWENAIKDTPWYSELTEQEVSALAQKRVDFDLDLGEYGEEAILKGFVGNVNNPYRLGASQFLKREIDVPYHLLRKHGVMDYMEDNAFTIYHRYMNIATKVRSMTEKFGDPFALKEKDLQFIRLVLKEGKTPAGMKKVNAGLQGFDNLIERMYYTFNTADPAGVSRQSADILRGVSALGGMGGVVPSSLTEMAMPFMVHGLSNTFRGLKTYITSHGPIFKKLVGDVVEELGEDEALFFGSMNRFIAENGLHASYSRGGRVLGAIHNGVNKAQIPFYWANLLTPWTNWWKRFSRVIGYQRFIRDAYIVTDRIDPLTGKAISPEQVAQKLKELKKYGIDQKTARLITTMPIERQGKNFLPNTLAWNEVKGGAVARRKLKVAVYMSGENTIITPDITDTPDIVAGATTFTGKEWDAIFANPLVNRVFKPQKTQYGYKVNATWASLPFQFMPWAFAATNRMLVGGGQSLSNGQGQVVVAMGMMLLLGSLVTYVKNPTAFENMTNEELVAESIERSGLLTIFGDLNFMLESVSEGFTDTPIGVRPLLGLEPRFGNVDSGSALGEILGPGPSIPIDLVRIYAGDYDYKTDHAMLRRMLPLQNLIFFKRLLRPLYDQGIEEILE